jgi:ribose 5-phosphate isomerase A
VSDPSTPSTPSTSSTSAATGSSDPSAIAAAKELTGRHAASYVTDGMRVGLGTGSTVHFSILELGDRQLDIVCTATSTQTEELARSLGLRVVAPDDIGALDLAIDGADEVDPGFNLSKGAGGAHTREKLVAQMSPRFIVVVDESKLVPELGPFGTALEVLDFAPGVVAERVEALGGRELVTRDRRSDNGNLLIDAHFGTIADPVALGRELNDIPGLVEHGLFPGAMVERVVVAGASGIRELVNQP